MWCVLDLLRELWQEEKISRVLQTLRIYQQGADKVMIFCQSIDDCMNSMCVKYHIPSSNNH
jgi:hypothetical protein